MKIAFVGVLREQLSESEYFKERVVSNMLRWLF